WLPPKRRRAFSSGRPKNTPARASFLVGRWGRLSAGAIGCARRTRSSPSFAASANRSFAAFLRSPRRHTDGTEDTAGVLAVGAKRAGVDCACHPRWTKDTRRGFAWTLQPDRAWAAGAGAAPRGLHRHRAAKRCADGRAVSGGAAVRSLHHSY